LCWRWQRGYERGEFCAMGDLLTGLALLGVGSVQATQSAAP
jgi:hypothetical protein